MKKHYSLFTSFFVVACIAVAQPTLTNSIVPPIGQSVQLYIADSNATVLPGGAGVTWDYSLLKTTDVSNPQEIMRFVSPSDTKDAASFTNSTYSDTVDGVYNKFYYSTDAASATEIYLDGFVTVINLGTNIDAVVTYTDKAKIYNFPVNYGDKVVDDYSGNIAAGVLTGTIAGKDTVEYVGYGTLKMPNNKTYNDVVMTKRVESAITSQLPLVGAVNITAEIYEYYHPATSFYPILRFVSSTINGNTVRIVYSQDLLHSGVGVYSEVSDAYLSTFPVPANDMLSVSLDNKENRAVAVYVTDVLGKKIANVYNGTLNTGVQKWSVDVSNMASGVYYVIVEGEDSQKQTSKFIVE